MVRKQSGVTLIGWIFLLAPMAVVLYAGLRAGPEYFAYYKCVQAMKETASQLKSDPTLSKQTIEGALAKRFDIGYVQKPPIDQIAIEKGGDGWQMTADYESTVPMFGNLGLLMQFSKTVVIGKAAAGD
jgi:hypothetical protein